MNSAKNTVLKLRPRVKCVVSEDRVDIDYRQQGCVIETGAHHATVKDLLVKLQGSGFNLGNTEPEYPTDVVQEIIRQLNALGLLVSIDTHPRPGISGEELAIALARQAYRIQHSLGNQALANALLQGSATRELLIGYVMEYYTLVKAAPSFIGSALNHELPPSVARQLKRLFLTEHDHDELLERSLAAVDIDKSLADTYVPLSSTYSLTASLSAFSRQHILSFLGSLFLLEEPHSAFNEVFVRESKRLGFPPSFWEPFILHSDINEEEAHADVTRDTLSEYSAISAQEANAVMTNIVSVSEILYWQSAQICSTFINAQQLWSRFYPDVPLSTLVVNQRSA